MQLRHFFKLYSLALCTLFLVAIVSTVNAAELVDINQASPEELAQTLPGIGPKKALEIVKWREEHGPFPNIETLIEVRGIGMKTLDKIRSLLTIGDVSPTALLQTTEGQAMHAVQSVISLARREAERYQQSIENK